MSELYVRIPSKATVKLPSGAGTEKSVYIDRTGCYCIWTRWSAFGRMNETLKEDLDGMIVTMRYDLKVKNHGPWNGT